MELVVMSIDKNIKIYKQRGNTCAIACLMMVLEYFNIIKKANWYDEKRLYRIYSSKCIDGTPFSALAYHLSKNGLDVSIYHSDFNFFSNKQGLFSEDDFLDLMNEYKEFLYRSESCGTQVYSGVEIDTNLIKRKLMKGNIIILAGEITGSYHSVLISGYNEDKFIVCDPLFKEKQTWTFKQINSFMNTAIGKWFISVCDKNSKK